MELKRVGVVGHGHFGAFIVTLVKRFLPEVEVRVYSRRAEPDGGLFFSLEEVAQCDVVVLCGSIAGYEEQVESIAPLLGANSIVVDVATVKMHTRDIFRRHFADRQYVCCHPMFGAESYKKTEGDVEGYRIVVVEDTLKNGLAAPVEQFLTALGFVVVRMSADEHDRYLAETLFMTHYIGQVMGAAGFGRTPIDTVSFTSLMNAVESVLQDGKLFMDVYNYNPYCEDAAVRFHDAQKLVLEGLLKKRI